MMGTCARRKASQPQTKGSSGHAARYDRPARLDDVTMDELTCAHEDESC